MIGKLERMRWWGGCGGRLKGCSLGVGSLIQGSSGRFPGCGGSDGSCLVPEEIHWKLHDSWGLGDLAGLAKDWGMVARRRVNVCDAQRTKSPGDSATLLVSVNSAMTQTWKGDTHSQSYLPSAITQQGYQLT